MRAEIVFDSGLKTSGFVTRYEAHNLDEQFVIRTIINNLWDEYVFDRHIGGKWTNLRLNDDSIISLSLEI